MPQPPASIFCSGYKYESVGMLTFTPASLTAAISGFFVWGRDGGGGGLQGWKEGWKVLGLAKGEIFLTIARSTSFGIRNSLKV